MMTMNCMVSRTKRNSRQHGIIVIKSASLKGGSNILWITRKRSIESVGNVEILNPIDLNTLQDNVRGGGTSDALSRI